MLNGGRLDSPFPFVLSPTPVSSFAKILVSKKKLDLSARLLITFWSKFLLQPHPMMAHWLGTTESLAM